MKKDNQKLIDSTDYLVNSASTQDCTGLIPGGLQNEEERKSYEEVYHICRRRWGRKNRNKMPGRCFNENISLVFYFI